MIQNLTKPNNTIFQVYSELEQSNTENLLFLELLNYHS
jgi:hypothetical protein